MKPLNPQDKENLRILRSSQEYISLDKLIKIRVNNLEEECVESSYSANATNAKRCADQSKILYELLDEMDIYNKEED